MRFSFPSMTKINILFDSSNLALETTIKDHETLGNNNYITGPKYEICYSRRIKYEI